MVVVTSGLHRLNRTYQNEHPDSIVDEYRNGSEYESESQYFVGYRHSIKTFISNTVGAQQQQQELPVKAMNKSTSSLVGNWPRWC